MRLLFLTYSIAGQSNYLRANSLARALMAEGHRITLLCAPRLPSRSGSTELQKVGPGVLRRVTVRSRSSERLRNSGLSMFEALRRRAAIARENFDLVHGFGHRPTVSWVGPRVARQLGIPYVADWCDLFGDGGIAAERALPARMTLGVFDRWTERGTYRRADGVSAISSALETRAKELAANRRVARVPPGGLTPASGGDRVRTRRRLGIPQDSQVVVHMSQNHQDIALLTETLKQTAALRRNLHFLLVGSPVPGADRELGPFADRIHSTGLVPHHQIPSLLAAADLALLPYPPSTKNECRFPCSFAEYVGAGLPVVTQPTGDLPRLNSGRSGALFAEADAGAMAAAVDRLLQTPDLTTDLRRQALEAAARELSWTVGAERLDAVYRQLFTAGERSTALATA